MAKLNNQNALNGNNRAPAIWGWPTYLSIVIAGIILIFAVTMVDL